MITREKAKEFVETYEQNMTLTYELDEQILGDFDMNHWPAFLEKRSEKLREMFATNRELLATVREDMSGELTEEQAAIVYEAILGMYDDMYDDPYLYELMGKKLIAFYEERGDYERLVSLYHLLGFELSEYNWGSYDREEELNEAAKYYLKVVALRDHYTEIQSARVRRFFYTAYCNLIAPLSQTCIPLRAHIFEYYDEAHALFMRPEVQALDAQDEDIRGALLQMDEDLLFAEGYFPELDEANQKRFIAEATRILGENDGDDIASLSGNRFRSELLCREVSHELTSRDLIDEALKEFENLPPVDYALLRGEGEEPMTEEQSEAQKNIILSHHNLAVSLSDYLERAALPDQEVKAIIARFLPQMLSLYTSIPYHYETNMVNEICVEGYMEMARMITDDQLKRDFLRRMIICRQPITLIHSKMVARIAVKIAEEILWVCPEKLAEACGYSSAQEVRQNREKVLFYISQCGLMHDVGKTCLVGIINQQSRPLSDVEFGMIREHPLKGLDVLRNDKAFEPFYDVICGHHKFYDGKGGYPMSFDNVASPKRFLIDLITIADCADAATDILGRNYTKGKDFDHLLRELIADAGTRYNPDIVRVIADSKRLQLELAELTTGGRYSVYYEAYQEIREL